MTAYSRAIERKVHTVNQSKPIEATWSSAVALLVLCLCVLWIPVPGGEAQAVDPETRISLDGARSCVDLTEPGLCDYVVVVCSEQWAPDEETYMPGDVDGDGDGPDADDLNYLVRYLFEGGKTPPVAAASDMDDSRVVDVNDLCLLIRRYFGESRSALEQQLRFSRDQLLRTTNARTERQDNAILLK